MVKAFVKTENVKYIKQVWTILKMREMTEIGLFLFKNIELRGKNTP